jgi:prepilin-type N-terminal cleavage/methylation domain-containing protein
MTRAAARRGFTLVELLVAMAVIIALASIALMVVPAALDQDRTTDGATLTRQWLMIAKSRAARDNLPRGVRLIVDPTKGANQLLVTELQYTEAPPVMIPKNDFPVGDPNAPQVVFRYTINVNGAVAQGGGQPARQCLLQNLDAVTFSEVQNATAQTPALLSLPVLGTWHKITQFKPSSATSGEAVLDIYPDAALGAAGVHPPPKGNSLTRPVYTTFHFGIYGVPRPLLGEPTLQMPRDICIDLHPNVSFPNGTAGTDYDIVFAPSGQLMPFGSVTTGTGRAGRVQLWVRNTRKAAAINGAFIPNPPGPGHWRYTATDTAGNAMPFGNAGEQLLVSIKAKSGALGVVKARWPDNAATGDYNLGPGGIPFTPYSYTYQGADESQ